jgi:hypothetical protein
MMSPTHRYRPDLAAAKTIFNTAAVMAGCLYRATGSVTATLIGTAGASILSGWTMWLLNNRQQFSPPEPQAPAIDSQQQAVNSPAACTHRREEPGGG